MLILRVSPYLKFEDGDGKEIPLISGGVWKIGRSEQNAVVLVDDMVSRKHAMLQQLGDGEFYLVDMGSRNGSFVNNTRVTAPVALRDGDLLSFGPFRLRFSNPAEAGGDGSSRGRAAARFKQATVSVLVVDIRGFSALAQKLDAGALGRLVNTWFAEVDRIVRQHGGTAEKHIGDAVMTVWTHGAKGNEHVEILRILRAAAEVSRMTGGLHEGFDLAAPLGMGAGVNTGLAAIGNTGGVRDFTAIGDSVDRAFELESAGKELNADVVLGASTFAYLRPLAAAAESFRASQTKFEGNDEPVETWHISFSELSKFLAKHREDRGTTIRPPLGPRRGHHA